MNNKGKSLIIFMLILVLVTSALLYIKNISSVESISYNEFLDLLDKDMVESVKIGDSAQIVVGLKNEKTYKTDNPRTVDFKKELLLHDVKVVEQSINLTALMFFGGLVISLTLFILYFRKYMFKNAEREITSLSNMEEMESDTSVKFHHVAGNEEAKENLKEMVDFIKDPDLYLQYGARLPRGVLLYGPPGTGKTLLAKALAGEAGVPIFPVSGSDFIQVYSGLGASRIRSLFKDAKEAGKSVIFIDEIDSLGKKRKGNNISGSDEGDRTLNALLAEMSGFKENDGIIVVAATNRIDVLDEALLRPGRFDRQIEVQLPDVNAREEILKLHGKNKPISEEVDFRKLAIDTTYFSGAKLENLLNESAMIAARMKDKEITSKHIDQAYYKVLVGDEKKDRSSIKIRDREITAYHEAGHALVSKLICKNNKVRRVSIIPSTKGMGGFSLNIPPDRMYRSRAQLIGDIKVALAGRAAEEIIFGREEITTGASSDLERATEISLALIGIYGMDDKFGLLNYNVIASKNFQPNVNLIDRANELLNHLYKETINILRDNKEQLDKLARGLLKYESLDEEDIDNILYEY